MGDFCKRIKVGSEVQSKSANAQKHCSEQRDEDLEGTGHDRISDLPEPLILHILSFLRPDDAFVTSFLSTRWRDLWASIHNLNIALSEMRCKDMTKVSHLIDTMLRSHCGGRRLRISFDCQDYHGHLFEGWIRLATMHVVDEIDIKMCCHYCSKIVLCKFPKCLFNSQSLRVLALRRCSLNLVSFVCLDALKTLTLEDVVTSGNMIGKLVSGSPYLEHLSILGCTIMANLKTIYPEFSRKGHPHGFFGHVKIIIDVPKLLSLKFKGVLPRGGFKVKNSRALRSVMLDFAEHMQQHKFCDKDRVYAHLLAKLLDDVHHSKVIDLCSWCVKALGVWMVGDLCISSLSTRSLVLRTSLQKWELPGVASLLKRFPNINSLSVIINMKCDIEVDFDLVDFDEGEYWKLQEPAFSSLLQHLQNITIYRFMNNPERNVTAEEHQTMTMDEFLDQRINEIEFVKFLLGISKELNKITINVPKIQCAGNEVESRLQPALSSRLLLFPKASPDAEILFSTY